MKREEYIKGIINKLELDLFNNSEKLFLKWFLEKFSDDVLAKMYWEIDEKEGE